MTSKKDMAWAMDASGLVLASVNDPPVNGNVLAFSGGADSTSMAYEEHDRGGKFTLLFTPTRNELPDVWPHVVRTALAVGAPLVLPTNKSLEDWINEFQALPNHRQRWCTRLIKLVPCIAYLKRHPGSTLLVGLRADEEEREGMYGEHAKYRFPLREYGWNRSDVVASLLKRGVIVPTRTDCAWCPYQRLGEWRDLWRDHPDAYAAGEAIEEKTGHTFRSPGRDTWPAALKDLRKEFEKGRKIRGEDKRRLGLLAGDPDSQKCRVCSG